MYNYRLVLSVKNSAGNELHKSWNFTCSIVEHWTLHRILGALHKEGYYHLLHDGWKNHKKKTPITFDQLCKELHEFRFYETKTTVELKPQYSLEYAFTMAFPCKVIVNRLFHSDWGGTFFELCIWEEDSLVKLDFEKLQKLFVANGLDLLKSKDQTLWYSHYFLEMSSVGGDIAVSKRVVAHERTITQEKVEL